jgi:predicted aconitase with swiveling domain
MASTNIQTFPGKVGVSNTNPVHTLDIGSNVYIDDTGANKLTVTGNIHASGITIDGDITVIDTQNLAVKDPVILLASESTGTTDTGIIMKRADGDSNVAVFYDEGVGLKLCHTMSGADDTQLVADTSNALNTSIYGAVTIENTTSQALSVGGGAQIDGDFQVGEVANLFVDTTTSNVGIGTAVPAYELDVIGNVHADYLIGDGSAISAIQSSNVSDFASNVSRIVALETDLGSNVTRIETLETDLGSNVTRIGNLESGDLTIGGEKTFSSNLEVGTANLFVDTTTGNVGVGTTEPGGPLDVVTSSEGDYIARFKNSGTAGDEDARIVIEASDADGESQILLQTTNESTTHKWNIVAGSGITPSLDFQYNCDFNGGTRAVMIKHGGNVVVGGTTSDYGPFTTYGGALHDGDGIFSSKTCATLDVDRGGGSVPVDTGTGAILEFRHADDYRHVTIESVSEASYSEDIGLRFKTVDTSAGPEERMRITSGGNVGIGTTNPLGKLQIDIPDASAATASWDSTKVVFGDIVNGNSQGLGFGVSTNSHASMISLAPGVAWRGLSYYSAWHKWYINDVEKMTLDASGNVGIGTDNPYCKLQVKGTGNLNINPTSRTYFFWGNTTDLSWDFQYGWFDASIYADGSIVTASYFVSHYGTVGASDTRIKKNIVDADDSECLQTLRLLKPKKYQYKDEINRGTEPVWGFIAQEVRETLPYATQLRKDVLPNIYELANVSQSNVITFTNFNTSNLESNSTTLIRTKGIDGEDHDIHLAEVIDEHTIRVEEDLSAWTGSVDETGNVVAGNQLFIYGQEVDDFVFLKKDAIWTVATSALQEVDRQLQAEKAKVATLETQLASVLARLDALENP